MTQQMVKCLNSFERSSFIVNYIGNPFSKRMPLSMRQCLVTHLCKEPYAGSLLVLLIEYFDELHSTKRKTKTEGQEVILALGATEDEAAAAFQQIWTECLHGVYPMEIKVLKETCVDKFENFIAYLEQANAKLRNPVLESQSIKLMQLLKGRPNYRALMEDEQPSKLNVFDEQSSLIEYDEADGQHLKTVVN